MNPDSIAKARPTLSVRVKQTIAAPRELINRDSSSAVQLVPLDMLVFQRGKPRIKLEGGQGNNVLKHPLPYMRAQHSGSPMLSACRQG